MITFTTAEVAEQLKVSTRKVRRLAVALGVGVDAGGRAGARYEQTDIDQMWDSMRPVQHVTPRRRRRAS